MNFRKCGALLAVLLLVILAGCGGREAALTGTWKIQAPTTQMPAGAANNPALAGMMAAMSNVTLEMRADKTFMLNMMGAPMEGTWTFDKDAGTVALDVTKVGNQTVPASAPGAKGNKALTFKLDDSNAKLTAQNPAGAPGAPGRGGIWKDVRESLSAEKFKQLSTILEKINTFRNRHVAHIDDPLQDGEAAQAAMQRWIQGLTQLSKIRAMFITP